MRSVTIFVIFLVLVSCSKRNKVPADIMGIAKMNEIMWDLSRADAMVVHRSGDSSFDKKQASVKLYEQVFRIHNTSREEFMKSMAFYQKNPEILKVMMDSLRSYERKILPPPVSQPPIVTDSGQTTNPVIEKAKRDRDSIKNFQRLSKPVRN